MTFFKVSNKDILRARQEIVVKGGIPELRNKGFVQSPMIGAYDGKDDIGFTYDLCRITGDNSLEIVTVFIIRGEKWIQMFLNIFKIESNIKSIEQLKGIHNLEICLSPRSLTKMRLRVDEVKNGYPFFIFFEKKHKIGCFYTKNGYDHQVKKLHHLIKKDMMNIDHFVKEWHKKHTRSVLKI